MVTLSYCRSADPKAEGYATFLSKHKLWVVGHLLTDNLCLRGVIFTVS
jgi:hypothetical protein